MKLAVIGGSGLYQLPGLQALKELTVQTPYGPPTDVIVSGRLGDLDLLFLPRHGRGHHTPPHQLNYRANICALKQLGATHLLAISAVGSLKEEIRPGHFVVVDQFLDFTKGRRSTFFEDGIVGHVTFADPVCSSMASALVRAARNAGASVHSTGTYVCIEGPQFSSRAESHMYRALGATVIGMTAMPEAKLAREAELPYALLAMSTDYDCWHEAEEDVSVEAILSVLRENAELARQTLAQFCEQLPDPKASAAHDALRYAVITAPDKINEEVKQRLNWLLKL